MCRENRENRDRPHFCTYYSYDRENRLTRIDYHDSDYSTYKYDALGRRIEKRDKSGNISRYVYDGHNMVAEYNGSNSLVVSYVQSLGIDRPISMYRSGEMYWYHTDALGSVYQMTDEDETVVRTYDYLAFGTFITETGALINSFTYTARELDDDSGLYYYRARYYDSTIGRFLSRDPVGLDKGEDIYVYVQNNPISLIDPTGKLSRKLARCYYACGYCVPSCVRDCRNRLKKVACPLLIQKIACPMLCEKQKNACIDCCDKTAAPDIFECAGHGFTEADCSDFGN